MIDSNTHMSCVYGTGSYSALTFFERQYLWVTLFSSCSEKIQVCKFTGGIGKLLISEELIFRLVED